MVKRFLKPTIKWSELDKLVPPDQKRKFFAFKGKSDLYLRRALIHPPELHPIDWAHYQKIVPVPGLVEKFKKEYSTYQVPYPVDTLSSAVDRQWEELQPEIKKFCEEMQSHINSAKKEIARIKSLPRFEDTTLEMVYDIFPDQAIDFVKKPSFWPHTPEEQLGYKDPTVKVEH